MSGEKIIFITGGARSGKSDFAVSLAKKTKKNVVFVATNAVLDDEMKQRVEKHKRSRPRSWRTIEEEINLASVIQSLRGQDFAIVDCITLWVSNLLLAHEQQRLIDRQINTFINALKNTDASLIIVSNEVGWGIVPDNELARRFRDIIGTVHQKITKASDRVYLMVGGIPLKIKGG